MHITTILIVISLVAILIIIALLILLFNSKIENRKLHEEFEGTYLIRHTDLVVNNKAIMITYYIPYKKRNELKKSQVNIIRNQLEINNYGESNFNEKITLEYLHCYELHNIRIIAS